MIYLKNTVNFKMLVINLTSSLEKQYYRVSHTCEVHFGYVWEKGKVLKNSLRSGKGKIL